MKTDLVTLFNMPFCRAYNALHEEVTCHAVKRIIDIRMAGVSHQINVFGKDYHIPIEDHESFVKEST